jgi:muramoyltetrapeptide carboxypeptidase
MARAPVTRRKTRSAPQVSRGRLRAASSSPARRPARAARGRTAALRTAAPRRARAPAPYRGWPALRPGDRVALFSPSSHQGQGPADALARARAVLAGWGLRPDELTPERRHLYLAGTDAERAGEFQRLYLDRRVKALFCTRGGYGSARILPLLDRARIAAAPPKPVAGFSDVTALFAWLHWAAGVAAVHGPCLAAPGALAGPGAGTGVEALRRILFDPHARLAYPARLMHRPGAARAGSVTGRLVGGCLSVLATTLGTPWALDTRGAILFLEDTDEAPYRIDRMLTHLRQAGRLDSVRAVVFGHLRRCDSDPPGLLEQALRDVFRDAPYPVASGLPAGHGEPNLPLLLGRTARLDFEAGPLDGAAQARLHLVQG